MCSDYVNIWKMSETASHSKWQRMTTSGTTIDDDCYNEWRRVTTSDHFG